MELDKSNEYVLLCNEGNDLGMIDPDIRKAANVSIVNYLAEAPGVPPLGDTATMLREAERYFDWLSRQELDLYHVTAPFLFERPVLTDFDLCPMVANFYDLIPLIFPAQYLSGWWREQYLRTAAFLGRATRMVAISEAAKTDAATFLGFPTGRIEVAWPIADECFGPLPAHDVAQGLDALRRRIPLPDQYVLTVSHLHHTKNLGALLRAYSQLPEGFRSQLPLVVCCHLDEHAITHLLRKAGQLGVADDLVLTGLVSDTELTLLYNGATVVVHPSRYEGFGLPVVEAMKCGAPVVTTTASSMPEAGGDAAVYVDPDDSYGFAAAIQELHADPRRRLAMSERGLAHSARFDKRQLGERTLDCYQAAVSGPASRSEGRSGPGPRSEGRQRRSRLAVWTPLPPQQSGISDYSVELLSRLRDWYDIEVFVDDGCLPPVSLLSQYRIEHFTAFDRRHRQEPFDAFLYQMGGSLFHVYMYDALRAHPGVVVLHDLTWSHVLYTLGYDSGDFEPFRRQVAALEGDAALATFDAVHALEPVERAPLLERFLGEHHMLGDIVDASLAQIVHVDDAAGELKRCYDNAHVFTVPMGVADPGQLHGFDNGRRARSRLRVSPSTFVIGTFGIVHPTKRLEECVRALASLVESNPDSQLIVVGRSLDEGFVPGLHRLAESLGVGAHIHFMGHVSRADFDEYMLACDVIVNLRLPTTTHMSAALIRAIAAGRPLIVTDLPEWRDIPEDIALRVPPGGDETGPLAGHLTRLASDADLRARMSGTARQFYESHGTLDTMAARYVDVLDKFGASAVSGKRTPAGRTPPVTPFRFNKVCEIEDFSRPELVDIIRDVCSYKLSHLPVGFPLGSEHRKDWEVAMAVRTLRELGALHREATILGVAAGAEDTSFFLTREAKQVFATDRYLASGDWEPTAPLSMLIQPQDVAPYEFEADRLVVQHMDGRHLHYPDNSFDGIYSSGSIEHFGDLDDVAAAAYEMGRVLKPGGVLTLSTEIRLGGPPGGIGWPGLTLLFSVENLQRFIVDASGLEPVDELDSEVSDETLSVRRDLTLAITQHLAATSAGGQREEYAAWEFPHIILVHEGYVFTSVHLALRKPDDFPKVPNAWARPSQATITAIAEHNRNLIRETVASTRPAPAPAESEAAVATAASLGPSGHTPGPIDPPSGQTEDEQLKAMERHLSTVSNAFGEIDQQMTDFDHLLNEIDRHVATMGADGDSARQRRGLLAHHRGELERWSDLVAESHAGEPHEPGNGLADDAPGSWTCSRVTIEHGRPFDVVVDPRVGDQVTLALSRGQSLDETLVDLMLSLIGPGDKVLDLGAHVGTFSLAAASVGAQSLAIEASPENASLLRASAARNGFANLTVVEAVASDSPGQARFHAHGPWGQVSLVDDDSHAEGSVTTVAAVTIGDLVQALHWSPLAFVKMDVEGWELQVLRGMSELLDHAQAPPLLYECNGHTLHPYGATPEELIATVEGLGYTSYMVDQGRLIPVGSGEFQPQTLVDYLAVKQVPALGRWPIAPALDLDERVARIVVDGTHANHNHRVYMGRALQRAGPEILDHPSIVELVATLRDDPVDDVRAVVTAWAGGVLASAEGGPR
ncbi:MAG: FkbM family methyltransferase [Acidimicrobiales bacterium]